MDKNHINVLIVGYGFIGKSFHKHYESIGLNVKVIKLRDADFFNKMLSLKNLKIDLLLVPAAITRIVENSKNSYDFNVKIASSIVNICANNTISNLVYFSTIDVYGQSIGKEKISESNPVRPEDYYSKSKLKSEQIISDGCFSLDTKLFIFRLAGVFGEYDNSSSIISKMISSAILKEEINVTVTPTIFRDYLYISDLIDFVNEIIQGPATAILNVTTGQSYNLLEIAQIIVVHVENIHMIKVKLIKQQSIQDRRSPALFFNISRLNSFVNFSFTPLFNSCLSLIKNFK